MTHLQPGGILRRPPAIPGNLQLPDSSVAINIIGPTPVATPLDVRAPSNFDRKCPTAAETEPEEADSRAPTPQVTPLESEQPVADTVVADAAQKLQQMQEQNDYFDFGNEEANQTAAESSQFFDAAATSAAANSTCADDAFAPQQSASDSVACEASPSSQAAVADNSFVDDQFSNLEASAIDSVPSAATDETDTSAHVEKPA